MFDQHLGDESRPVYLLQSGTYTLVIYGYNDTIGSFALRLLDITNQPTVVTNTTNAIAISPAPATVIRRFAGVAGQKIVLESVSYTGTDAEWLLVDPANEIIAYQPFLSIDLGTNLLNASGTYLIVVRGTAQTGPGLNFQFRIRDVSDAPVSASGFNIVRSGTVNPGQTNSVGFAAPAGTPAYYDALVRGGESDIGMEIIAPSGETMVSRNSGSSGWGNATFDYGPFVLPQSGTYTIRIIGNSGGSYRFKLLNLWSNSTAISYGVTNAGSFGETNATVVYRVTASPGQWLYYDSLVGWRDVYIGVWRTTSPGWDRWSWDTADFWMRAGSLETLYYILSSQTGEGTTSYRFRVIDLEQAPAIAIPLDTTITNAHSDLRAAQVYRVNLNAGQRLFIDFTGTYYGWWELRDPDCNVVRSRYTCGDETIDELVTGTYALTVSSAESEEPTESAYSFRLAAKTASTNTLVFGTAYSNSVSTVGREHYYTFAGSNGMRIYFDALQDTTSSIPVRLIAPNGEQMWMTGDADEDTQTLIALSQTGTYSFVFGGQTDATGSYTFRVIEVNQPPASALVFNTVVSGTNNPYHAVLYRVPVEAGKSLFCDSQLATYSGTWTLVDVENSWVGGNSLAFDFEPTPGLTGTGVLVVKSDSNESCPYRFRVVDPTRVTNSIAIGTLVSNQLADAGTEHYLRFDAAIGQRLYFDALDQYASDVWIYMDSLDRTGFIWYGSKDQDAGISTVHATGAYTLRVHNSSSGSVNYRFRILDLASQPALSLGTPTAGQLNPRTQTHIYRITATAGQKIQFQSVSASSSEANWLIQNPFNRQIAWANIMSDLGTVFFDVSGTYALIIQGRGSESQTLDYQFLATDVSDAAMPANGFGAYSGYIAPGQTNYVYFNAAAGTPVYIDSLINNNSVTLWLLDTNGVVVLETLPGYGSAGLPDPGFCVLPSSGTYTVAIEAYNGGDYAFRILNLTEAPAITFGSNYTVSFTNAFQTDVYRVSCTTPHILFYDALRGSGDDIYLALVQPDGEPVLGGIGFWDWYDESANEDYGPISLSQTNIYYLVVMSGSDQTPEYKFRLLNMVASTRINLGVSYTNTPSAYETVILHFTNPPAGYFFDALEPNWYLYWQHIPAGSGQVQFGGWGDFESTSPLPGTNFVVLRNNHQNTFLWPFRIFATVTTTNAITPGTVYSNLLTPGGDYWYTFTGTAWQKVYYDSLIESSWSGSTFVELYEPSGRRIWNRNISDDSVPPPVLTGSGTCYLHIYNSSDQLVPCVFRVLDVGVQPLISLDITNTITASPGTAAQLVRFYYTNQVRLYFDSLNTEWPYAFWYVYSAANQYLGNNSVGWDFEVTTGDLSGELLLIVNGYSMNQYAHTFRIIPGNHAPVFTSPRTATVDEQTTLAFTNTVFDLEAPNDQIMFALAGTVPSGLNINPTTGVITWIPSEAQGPSTNTVTVIAADDGEPPLSSSINLTIVVNEVNRPPTLTMPNNQILNELTAMAVYATASDPDIPTNTLVFALVSAPSGANINPNTGLITWTPSEAQGPSTNTITVKVTDSNPWAINEKQLSGTNSFVVVVNEVNSAPVLPAQTNRTINELTTLTVTNTATDSDIPANLLTYQLLNPPTGAVISTNGIITWTPTEAQGPGLYTITTVVTDNGTPQRAATNSFNVIVNEINSPPVLNVPPNTNINELATLAVAVSATDTDLPTNTLWFSLISPPTGMVINTNSGLITWTPTEAQGPSTNIITVVATDLNTNAINAQQLSVTNSFTVVVNEVNSPPVLILPANQVVHAGTYIALNATASDPDIPPNACSFALLSGPTGLTVGTEGLITWQTTDTHAGTTNTVTVRVTDNGVPPLSSTNSFVITVLSRPVITSIKRSNELVTITWTSIAGTVYRLQYKTNLTDPTWLSVPGDVVASGSTVSKTDNPGDIQRRFYRVIAP